MLYNCQIKQTLEPLSFQFQILFISLYAVYPIMNMKLTINPSFQIVF